MHDAWHAWHTSSPTFRIHTHIMTPAQYGPFPYSAITRRPRFELPGGARVALWVITNIDQLG